MRTSGLLCDLLLLFQLLFRFRQLSVLQFRRLPKVIALLRLLDLLVQTFDLLTELLYFSDDVLLILPLRL